MTTVLPSIYLLSQLRPGEAFYTALPTPLHRPQSIIVNLQPSNSYVTLYLFLFPYSFQIYLYFPQQPAPCVSLLHGSPFNYRS
jgi:hypothetical protein